MQAEWIGWYPPYIIILQYTKRSTELFGTLHQDSYIFCRIRLYMKVIHEHFNNVFMAFLSCKVNWLHSML